MSLKNFFLRSVAFTQRYRKHPLFVFLYGVYFFNPSAIAGATFFSPENFTREIRKGKSFLRFGDGEIHIMNGGSLPSQQFDERLSSAMRNMTKEYDDNSPYIIGFSRFINMKNIELKKENVFYGWLPSKVLYKILFPKNVSYGDAHFFYYDGSFQKYLEPYLMDKHLIIVSNEANVNSLKNNKNIPFKKMSFVVTPKKNAYSEFSSICEQVDTCIGNIPQGETPVIILAAGPTSKQIVYFFSQKGIQSLDIGTGFEVLYKEESLERDFVLPK
ncbi:MAG: hypothetical protein JWQ09_3900 [Segetibacter sp.]|nr:hypothetical protein [Segetibacter sp.]